MEPMQILTILPLSKSLPKDHLTYFSTKEISLGDIVEIPIKKQQYKGLVIAIDTVQNQKSILKELRYALRPITQKIGPSPFSSHLLTMVHQLQRYYLGSLSEHIDAIIPHVYIEHISKLTHPKPNDPSSQFSECAIFQNSEDERISYYKTLIRESFARNKSIRFIAPTIQDVMRLESFLSKGIQDHCLTIHSKKTKKQLLTLWNEIQTTTHPLCLIHTPLFLSVPRHDTETIIVEYEHKTSYRTIKKPYQDTRIYIELYARLHKHRLIFADELLRTETLARHHEGDLGSIGNPSFRIHSPASHTIIDARTQNGTPFSVLSPTGWTLIERAIKRKEKMFIFSLKPNIASVTVCGDCGNTLTDKHIPLELIETKEGKRMFKNKHTGELFDSTTTCRVCGSWNLNALGLGTQRIHQEIHEHFPDVPITRIDGTLIRGEKQITETLEKFWETPEGACLIGSPIVLPYLTQTFPCTYIVSIDSLFTIPQYNMYEQIMHLVRTLSHTSSRDLYMETRHTQDNITTILESKKLLDFFTYDYTERKEWGYPPFGTLIKFSFESEQHNIRKAKQYLEKISKDYELFTYQSPSQKPSQSILHAILKLPHTAWPYPWNEKPHNTNHLRDMIQALSPHWHCMVNPHNLL